ncbi:unnamed protein product [Pieris macdunnoughi]|uniref:Uncharacterized protein n=1 Tax=Pieris macdunnoughi TaxID=345717 RepID=A0A821MIJ4_9NEOP|nr:unnamed protein product [Pieris macdunnoughi]
MVVTRKRKYDNPRLTMNKEPIIFTNKIRILGVEIDAALTFKGHIDNLYSKTISIYRQVSKVAKIGWGTAGRHCNPYTAVIEPSPVRRGCVGTSREKVLLKRN